MRKLLLGIFGCTILQNLHSMRYIYFRKEKNNLYYINQYTNTRIIPAPAARTWGMVPGNSPPPSCSMPPTMVIPEIAFVMAIRGECSACDTPC